MDVPAKTIQKLEIEVIMLSLVLLVGAMLWTWQIGMTANGLDHRLGHASEDLIELRQNIKQLEAKRR
jgi:hypothetical protein